VKVTLQQLRQIIKEEVAASRSRLDEYKSDDKFVAAVRQNVSNCLNSIGDTFRAVKKSRPGWQDVLVTLRDAENELEAAHQALLSKKAGEGGQ
jgi:hypothetical protein